MFKQVLLAAGISAVLSSAAQAVVTVNIWEDAGGVFSTYSGTLNLAGVSTAGTFYSSFNELRPADSAYYRMSSGFDGFIASASDETWTTGLTGDHLASAFSGDTFGFHSTLTNYKTVYFADDYISGALLSGSMSWAGETLASLGLIAGSYANVMSWGTGDNADFISMNIRTSVVPIPAGLPLLAGGLGILALVQKRRKKAVA